MLNHQRHLDQQQIVEKCRLGRRKSAGTVAMDVEPPPPLPIPCSVAAVNFTVNDRTPPLHSLPPLPLFVDDGAVMSGAAAAADLVPSSCHRRCRNSISPTSSSSSSSSSSTTSSSSSSSVTTSQHPGRPLPLSTHCWHDDGGGTTKSSRATNNFSSAVRSRRHHRRRQQPCLSLLFSSSFEASLSASPTSLSILNRPCRRLQPRQWLACRPSLPRLSVVMIAIFFFIFTFGPLDFVAGQEVRREEIRRQYWLMCPTSGGNATINITCMGVSTPYAVDANRISLSRVGDAAGTSAAEPSKGRSPIIRIVELRAHLISDQKVWNGFGPRTCMYTRELNKTTGEIAMASLGSLPVPVDPQDNVSDMLMKNCQAQTYCLSTDSKNINARQFSETFKAIPEAGDVFHDTDKQMKVPVVLELAYMCTANPSKTETIPVEMCPTGAKNASVTNIPVDESGMTSTWLWSPNYQREDTPSQTSCECILRSSSPSINVTLVAYHVRSWNSKTGGFRNVINKKVVTMYNDQCTENSFEQSNDPCIPALCRASVPPDNGGGSLQYAETSRELRLSSECLFPGVGIAPADREFYMRRVWFAIEVTMNKDGEQNSEFLRRRRRKRSSRRRRRRHVRRRRRQADDEEVAEAGDEEAADGEGAAEEEGGGGEGEEGGNGGEEVVTDEPPPEEEPEAEPEQPAEPDEQEQEDIIETTTAAEVTEATEAAEPDAPEEEKPEAAETTDAPEYDDGEAVDAGAPAATTSRPQPTGKPTVTLTCYNYARTAPPTGQQRGAASSSLLPRASFIVMPTAHPLAFILQQIVRNSPVFIFAALVHLMF